VSFLCHTRKRAEKRGKRALGFVIPHKSDGGFFAIPPFFLCVLKEFSHPFLPFGTNFIP
jgi:hypothetical protein